MRIRIGSFCVVRATDLDKVSAEIPLAKTREEVVRVFARLQDNDPVLGAVMRLLEDAYREFNSQGIDVSMADHPGQLAHCAGAQCALDLVGRRIRAALIDSRKPVDLSDRATAHRVR